MGDYLPFIIIGSILLVILSFALLKARSFNLQLKKELELAKNHLIQSEKLSSLGLFTAGISHEINNPVNHISGASQVLFRTIDEGGLENKEREIAFARKSINDGLQNVQKIIERLRTYSNTKSDRFIEYNIIDCIEDALILLKPFYMGKVIIDKAFPDQVVTSCIPAKMSQLFVILIGNAIEASNKGGKIAIKISQDAHETKIEIEDNGIGISDKQMNSIFDPFITTKEKGLGLGLFVAKQLIEENQGRLDIVSKEGAGTNVSITLQSKIAGHNDQTHS